jgi:hypothetical protein
MTWDGVRRRMMRVGGVAQLVVLAAAALLWVPVAGCYAVGPRRTEWRR